jgi:formate dehydrogenase gamma subunit
VRYPPGTGLGGSVMGPLKLASLITLLVGFSFSPPALGQEPEGAMGTAPTGCTDCHRGKAGVGAGLAPSEALAYSVHEDMDCADCHQSISMDELDAGAPRPHGSLVEPVNCGECHEDQVEIYQKHGRKKVGTDPDSPSCASCHGTHDILPVGDLRSRVHPSNVSRTCEACHVDVNLVKKHDPLRDAPIKMYRSSVHGQATSKGIYLAATCNDCHSAKAPDGMPTAHRILSAADPESTIYHFSIPDTCGKCHASVTGDYWDGIHGQLVKRGSVDSPVCTHCHGEHGIISPSDARSPVSTARLAEETCAPCHESAVLNEKYGIPAGRLRSYVDSYHGLKSKAGDVHVANCASCHGAHRILPHTDPTSSIHPNRLQETCGKCHPGISAQMAKTPIHETATGIKTGWPYVFRVFYLWLIGVTIGLMVLHNVADWVRCIKQMRKKPFVVRLTANETLQHWVLMISFIALVISGFALRFSEAWWVRLLFGWGDGRGFVLRGTIHRIAAVVMLVVVFWHVIYLFGARGRLMFREMLASPRDLKHIWQSALYFLGRREQGPSFGRFTYMEKCEYWALVWGAGIMGVTGLLLWFDDYFVTRWNLPKGLLDVALVIHYYEAWLATLAIGVWHIYGTIFSPSVYPMNPAWINGRMPKDMYAHEHPEGPKLKARIFRAYFEEEIDEGEPGRTIDSGEQGPAG